MLEMTYDAYPYKGLIDTAMEATKRAYTPYSHFQVGAALMDTSGKVWEGVNIESASYTPTNCAERTAVFKAVSEGVKNFQRIAVLAREEGIDEITEDFASPCGVCRQVLAEFCSEDMEIILMRRDKTVQIWTLKELLPLSFTKKNLS